MAVEIKSIKGYFFLEVWNMANVIQMATRHICERVLNHNNDPCGRQFDQMTQAARSITANIAEGCSRHQTSIETEMRLLDVARASAAELAGDIFFLMLQMGIAPWKKDSDLARRLATWRLQRPVLSEDWQHEIFLHLTEQYAAVSPWIEHKDISIALNTILFLCNREITMLERMLQSCLLKFKAKGGFSENMTQERLETRREQSAGEGAPRCPECGKPMLRRVTKKGSRQGMEFWGCSNYPTCKGILPTAQSRCPTSD